MWSKAATISGLVLALAAASPVRAALVTYAFTGTITEGDSLGAAITGSLSYDPSFSPYHVDASGNATTYAYRPGTIYNPDGIEITIPVVEITVDTHPGVYGGGSVDPQGALSSLALVNETGADSQLVGYLQRSINYIGIDLFLDPQTFPDGQLPLDLGQPLPGSYVYWYEGNQASIETLTRISPSDVPESAIWVMLLAGFGVLGVALRRGGAVRFA